MRLIAYLIAVLAIVAGFFSGIYLYQEITATSYINGSVDIENEFSMESFVYSSTNLNFYHDLYDTNDTYLYEIELLPVEDFNGQENEYESLLNKYVLTNAVITAGTLTASFSVDFYDTEGDLTSSTELDVYIEFLADKTNLTLSTIGLRSASFLESYFENNGLLIEVNEIL